MLRFIFTTLAKAGFAIRPLGFGSWSFISLGGEKTSQIRIGESLYVWWFSQMWCSLFMSHITNRCLKYKPQIPTLFLVLLTTIKRYIWSVHKTFVAFESSLIFMQKKNKICFCYLSKCYFPQDRPDQIKRYNKRTGTSFLLLRKIESGSKKTSQKSFILSLTNLHSKFHN